MQRRFRVAITDFIADDLAPERRVLGELAEVVALDGYSEQDLAGRIEDADAIMLCHNLGLTEATISRLNHCRLIVRCGVGIDNIDRAVARSRGIAVANVPDYGSEEVADSAIGFMLALTRGIALQNTLLQSAPLQHLSDKPGAVPWMYANAAPLRRLRGRVFGIVGLGNIGSAAALRAKALGMDVVYFDPYAPDGRDKALGVRRCEELHELLEQAHVLSMHCPLSDETRHMIDAAAIARLPRGAYLVNTARGAIVDTAAIPPAIAAGQLAGAGIDVLPHEPPPADDPLVAAWRDPAHPAHYRVLINPHSAFYSEEGLLDMRIKGSEACRRALLGLRLRNVVN